MNEVIIGTRGSVLALWQANFIKDKLSTFGIDSHIKIIKTTGDKILDAPLAKIGGKGLFTKELEEQILSDKITLAVHSLKDVPVLLPNDLTIAAITKREDERDCFLSHKFSDIKSLPHNARVGTTSLRRAMQLKYMRNDLQTLNLRGNVQTRLEKLKNGEFDAIILAKAALNRLNIQSDSIAFIKTLDFMIPAFGQGALGIECKENCEILDVLERLNDTKTQIECEAEREFVRLCNGGCQVPIGVNAKLSDNILQITAILGLPNGAKILKESISGDISQQNLAKFPNEIPLKHNKSEILSKDAIPLINAKNLAQHLYKSLESQGAKDLLDEALKMIEDYFG